ncbi:MAG: barstar family protein [Burkholderiaceae bacterium]
MSSLTSMPAHVVLPLAAYDLEGLRKAAERADQRWIHADCSRATDRRAVLQAIADAADFPDWFGLNLDALFDCVTDLVPDASASRPGVVFVLQNLPESAGFDREARHALIDVFRDAADEFYDRGIAFRVFYSVAAPPA